MENITLPLWGAILILSALAVLCPVVYEVLRKALKHHLTLRRKAPPLRSFGLRPEEPNEL
jgi:hypothetical protein